LIHTKLGYMKEFQIRRKMFQRLDATAIKSWDAFPIGKRKRKYQVHIEEEEGFPPSKKALAEVEEYVL